MDPLDVVMYKIYVALSLERDHQTMMEEIREIVSDYGYSEYLNGVESV